MNLSSNQYVEIFDKLPMKIKDMVASSDTSKKILTLGQKHHLHIDQIGRLIDIVLDVMMGIRASRKMIDDVVTELEIPKLDASALVRDLDDEVFKPIKSEMVKIFGDGAPYRPTTMKFIDESDEDHLSIHKDELLRDIEDPKDTHGKQNITPNSSTKVIEEYHTEISGQSKTIKPEPKPQPKKEEINIPERMLMSRERLLQSILSKELKGIVKMPGEEGAGVENKKLDSVPASPNISQNNTNTPDISIKVEENKIPTPEVKPPTFDDLSGSTTSNVSSVNNYNYVSTSGPSSTPSYSNIPPVSSKPIEVKEANPVTININSTSPAQKQYEQDPYREVI